jgi:hypothetical protein
MGEHTELDDRDQEILAHRVGLLNKVEGPRVGDFVTFSNGVERRISYIWRDEQGTLLNVQTSDGGSYYLGDSYVSMSGGLFPGVKPETLALTDSKREGSVWFFHHDLWIAHNGVGATLEFRVFTCTQEAPR